MKPKIILKKRTRKSGTGSAGAYRVAIAIQARSNNTRLPGKVLEDINGKTMLDRVIDACQSSASFINNGKGDVEALTCLLTPSGDPIAKKCGHKILTIQGSEEDVLSRYVKAVKQLEVDYICRITSDCPMIPPFLITKHILTATKHNFDYVTNTFPKIRTAPDGYDCEVLSKDMIEWLAEAVEEPFDKEHVTTYAKEYKPDWARYANIVSYTDDSHLKLSVDTEEDLHFVRLYDELIERKIQDAKMLGEGFFRI